MPESTEQALSDLDVEIRQRFAPRHSGDDRPHRPENPVESVTVFALKITLTVVVMNLLGVGILLLARRRVTS